jgi:hypothetical protein
MTEAGAGASVTLELSYDARARERLPDELQRTVGELRRSLEQPRNAILLPDFQTASWRIARTTFAPDAFFGERTQSACEGGCALHEATSIDMRRTAFVAAPAVGADVRTDLEFSGLDSLYGEAPRAVISHIGFGEYHGFALELPGGLPQAKASCQ